MSKISWGFSPIPKSTYNLIDSQIGEFFQSFFSPRTYKTDFPVNVLYEKDGEATSAVVLEVALAGVSRDRIKVSATTTYGQDTLLSIDVSKGQDTKDGVYKGISDKKWHCSYTLSELHDSENITSEFVDGLLRIRVPIAKPKEPETKVKEITLK